LSKIAFVGLGAMGLPMASRLVAAGHQVRGFDINPSALAALKQAGGEPAADASAAAAGAEFLILMVVSADQAEDVLFSAGAAEALGDGALVALMATCAPGRAAGIGERLKAMGRDFLDAPVSGGVVGAKAGTLTIMGGGPSATYERALPILQALGDKLKHIGEQWGSGSAMKTVNQLLAGVHIVSAAEALNLAAQLGIEPRMALEIMGSSAAGSWMLNNRGPRMLEDDPEVTSAVDIFVKDLGLVLQAGASAKTALPLSAASHQLFLAASGKGLGRADDSQVIQILRGMGPGKA
jgi:putative dehydrogenase